LGTAGDAAFAPSPAFERQAAFPFAPVFDERHAEASAANDDEAAFNDKDATRAAKAAIRIVALKPKINDLFIQN
jgi:hypothetical protein